jgi:predicted nuclease of predicted toxin-antitoxin system
MNFKLDENFGTRTQHLFRKAGHTVKTVRDQNLQGAPDNQLFEVCCTENFCMVTLDLDFCDVTRFPPSQSAGIVVIRVAKTPTLHLLEKLVDYFLNAIKTTPIKNELWIVEIGRIRIHQSENSD